MKHKKPITLQVMRLARHACRAKVSEGGKTMRCNEVWRVIHITLRGRKVGKTKCIRGHVVTGKFAMLQNPIREDKYGKHTS